MNYIYDIYLNFNNITYEFFEWNKKDLIIHIKKIPIYKVNKKIFEKIYCNKIKIENNFLKQLKYKTEIWKRKKKIEYCCLFSYKSNIIAVKFNKKGESIEKSNLLIDEEIEIVELIKNLKENNIKLKVVNHEKQRFYSRLYFKKKNFINNELKNISNEKLKYIYFECFNKYNKKHQMLTNLKKLRSNNIKFEKLYNILKLISTIQK